MFHLSPMEARNVVAKRVGKEGKGTLLDLFRYGDGLSSRILGYEVFLR